MYYNLQIVKIPAILRLNKKRIIIVAILVIVAILGFNFFAGPKTQTMQFTQVKKEDITSTVSSSGILTGKEIADLKFKSGGKLAYINVKAGDTVKAYQTIAGLDTTLLAIDLQQAQNTLRDKQASAEKVEDDVKDHSKDETYTQRATRTTAQVARDNAYDGLKAAQKALQDGHIFTSIAGIVTQAPFVAGQNVSAADLIAQVVNLSEIYFDTDVDEADIGKVSLGQSAEVILDAYPDQIFEGEVDQIIPQTRQTSSGATVVTVRINLDNPKLTFVNGLTGQASIITAAVKNALTIPQEALKDGNTVFIQKNGSISLTKVTPGIYSDTLVEIKEGLEKDEKVLLNPPANGTGSFRNRSPLQGIFR